MFIRTKSSPNSPRKTIQICEAVRKGKSVRQVIVRHVGVAKDEQHLQELLKLAKHIKSKIEEERFGPCLFPIEELEKNIKHEAPPEKPCEEKVEKCLEKQNLVDLDHLYEEKRIVEGFHDIFGKLFRELGFHQPLSKRYADIFRDVVLARIACPASKHKTQELLAIDFNRDIPLDSIYSMMDKLIEKKAEIQKQVFLATQSLFAERVNVVFFDVTTLYFESIEEDGLRDFGYSKDQKFHMTQVVLALATNEKGLPIGYQLFPGNTAEVSTLLASLEEWKKTLLIGDVCFIADRAMMSEKNLSALEQAGIKYIIAAKLKKMPIDIRQQILHISGETITFDNEKIKKQEFYLSNQRRLIVTHSEKRASKDKRDRDRILEKIKEKTEKAKNIKKLVSNKGYLKFLRVEGQSKLILDEGKIQEDAQWDGLHGLITNEEEKKAEDLLALYRRLWVIEESFRIQKHDLEVRPVYHFKPERIEAHILLCYVAFSLIRHAEYCIEVQQEKMSFQEIRKTLWRVQSSILKDKENGIVYRLPSKMAVSSKKIYQAIGVLRSENITEIAQKL